MQSTLRNNFIQVTINDKGAELCSLKNSLGTEFIWQSDASFWARHAPILFPIVGRLKNDCFQLEDESFKMNQHGFARDLDFQLEIINENEATFFLEWNDNTLNSYPFKFKLTTNYLLVDKKLIVTHLVKNCDNKPIPFSIGAHPAFNCPIGVEEKFEDYFLEFEKEEVLESLTMRQGYFTGEKFSVLANKKVVPLNYDLFKKADTLVFENIKSDWVMLCSPKHQHQVKVSLEGFPFLGIWTKPNAPFICIEPWFGLADYENHDVNIFNKKGIQILQSGKNFNCNYTITCD